MALTLELVDRVARVVQDAGPTPGRPYFDDADFAGLALSLCREAPAGELWLFAYGSLLWNPACRVVASMPGLALGWHRAFRLRLTRWRGTREQPGLMLVLDRGGLSKLDRNRGVRIEMRFACGGDRYDIAWLDRGWFCWRRRDGVGRVHRDAVTGPCPNVTVGFDCSATNAAAGSASHRRRQRMAGRPES